MDGLWNGFVSNQILPLSHLFAVHYAHYAHDVLAREVHTFRQGSTVSNEAVTLLPETAWKIKLTADRLAATFCECLQHNKPRTSHLEQSRTVKMTMCRTEAHVLAC